MDRNAVGNKLWQSLCLTLLTVVFCRPVAAINRPPKKAGTAPTPTTQRPVAKKSALTAKKTTTEEAPIIKSLPPAGFAMLSKPQDVLANIYANGSYLGEFMVTYTPHYVALKDPKVIVKQIQNVTDRLRILRVLTGHLAPHTTFVCEKNHTKSCKPYLPEEAGVVFDMERYRLDIFVNHRYMKKASNIIHVLPPSDGTTSLSQQYTGAIAGGKGYQQYTLTNNSVLAYKASRLNLGLSFNSEHYGKNAQDMAPTNNTSGPNNVLFVNDLNSEFNFAKYRLQTGYINSDTVSVFPQQSFLGMSFGTSLDTIDGLGQAYGSQLRVFLPTPSQVSILKDGRLVTSGSYDAGNQILDTSKLPDGAYTITLLIKNSLNVTTRVTRFYVKTSKLPPRAYPQYYADVGYLTTTVDQNDVDSFGPILPDLTRHLFFELGMKKRVGESWGFDAAVAGTKDMPYIGGTLYYEGKYFDFEPQLLAGYRGAWGYGINSRLSLFKFNASFYARRLYLPHREHAFVSSNCTGSFCPITGNTTQLTGGLGFPIPFGSFAFNADYSKTDGSNLTYSYGPELSFYINHWQQVPINLNFTANRSQDGWGGMATMTLYFNGRSNWSLNSSVGQGFGQQKGLIGNIGASKSWLNAARDGLSLSAQTGWQGGVNTSNADVRYSNGFGSLDASVMHSRQKGESNTQYSGNYSTNLVWTGHKIGVGGGGSNSGNGAGILAEVKSDKPGKFEVLANDVVVKEIKTNSITPINLTPFKTYQIRIRPSSKTNFAFDQTPKVMTLYKGNFKALTWETHRKVIIYTHVVQANGKAIKNSLVKGGTGFNYTDEEGDLQAEVLDNTKFLTLYPSDTTYCKLTLPSLKTDENLMDFKELKCGPHKEGYKQ